MAERADGTPDAAGRTFARTERMIELADVTKTYRQGGSTVGALNGITLEVKRGGFVSIVGRSGSGKSTLLHLLGGLDAPDAGRIVVGGVDLTGLSDDELTVFRRRQIGFVFQFFNLLPTLTVEENVALPLLLDGRRGQEIGPRVEKLVDRVGLSHRRTHRPGELSGGEMQRTAIARALVAEPAVVLADEPTGNLDSATGGGILALFAELAAERRQTVVMVTHDLRAAEQADRVVTLADGRIADDDAPAVRRLPTRGRPRRA